MLLRQRFALAGVLLGLAGVVAGEVVLLSSGGGTRAESAARTPIVEPAEHQESAAAGRVGRVTIGRIRGRVVDPGGDPLKGATVAAFLADDGEAIHARQPVATTRTSRQGVFVMRGLPCEPLTLVASHPGRVSETLAGVSVPTTAGAQPVLVLRPELGADAGPEPGPEPGLEPGMDQFATSRADHPLRN